MFRDELDTCVDLLVPDGQRWVNWEGVLRADPCAYCGGPGGTIDHIDPRANGASNKGYVKNGTGACPDCNVAKSDRSLLHHLGRTQWLAEELKRNQDHRLARSFFTPEQIEFMREVYTIKGDKDR